VKPTGKLFSTAVLAYIINIYTYAQPPGEVLHKMQQFANMGNVLYVAAHPDDENTRLIAWLANEKKYRTGYLSLTRGDGGQNLIGAEQGNKLGIIRTQELIGARAIDGGEQFFTRAIDFGYSKNPEETFNIWGKDSVLKDVVWVIRKFRPEVIICRFGTDGSGGHGHHTASALLAEEAFDLAANPKAFPEQLKYVTPFQPKILVWNYWQERHKVKGKSVRMEVGGYQPLLGLSYGEIASMSRSMHKSQGFGVAKNRGEIFEFFLLLRGDADTNNLFSGMKNGWLGIKGGAEIVTDIHKLIKAFNPMAPMASLPGLMKIWDKLQALPDFADKQYKKEQLKSIIKAVAGLHIEANSDAFSYAPGDTIPVLLTAIARITESAKLISFAKYLAPSKTSDTVCNLTLPLNKLIKIRTNIVLPTHNLTYTAPYWLQHSPHHQGLQHIPMPQEIGMPDAKPPVELKCQLNILGRSIEFDVPLTYKWVEPADGEKIRPIEILPALHFNLDKKLLISRQSSVTQLTITLTANKAGQKGQIAFNIPAGWELTPSNISFNLSKKGETEVFTVQVKATGTASDQTSTLQVFAHSNTGEYKHIIDRINYAHIPPQICMYEAAVKLLHLQNNTTFQQIGYIRGAGDEVATALSEAGYKVQFLDDETIMKGKLTDYQAIVVGIRAYNVHDKMQQFYPRLMNYVAQGGNLVVQYNTSNWLSQLKSDIGPYPFKIGRDRVTDEQAKPTFLQPNHPVFHYPNKIKEADFDNWVQERGIYFASEYDNTKYEAPIAFNDPGETQKDGSLIIARHGKGHFVYTGLAFFRQLPAGVPGAFRLFTNLIELQKAK
jgi:LmbE family N-acetylglucosaminyl deacetylase